MHGFGQWKFRSEFPCRRQQLHFPPLFVHLLVTVCSDTAALNHYLQSPLPSSFRCSLPSGIFSFPEFIPFPLSIPMVPDYSRTIMSLVTIVLHVKRVLTNDKDELWHRYVRWFPNYSSRTRTASLRAMMTDCAYICMHARETFVDWVNNGLWERTNIEEINFLFPYICIIYMSHDILY